MISNYFDKKDDLILLQQTLLDPHPPTTSSRKDQKCDLWSSTQNLESVVKS